MSGNWKRLVELAECEIEKTLGNLPGPLREQAEKLPVTLEKAPGKELQMDGVEPDTLGIFTGAEHADDGMVPIPPQIMLFLENLWEFAGENEEIFCEEVQTTFLHELGHFLGLGEDDLMDRGLE